MLVTQSKFITNQYSHSFIFDNNKMVHYYIISILIAIYLPLKCNKHKAPKEWAFKFTVLLICFYLITGFTITITLSTNALWWVLRYQCPFPWRIISQSFLCVMQCLRTLHTYSLIFLMWRWNVHWLWIHLVVSWQSQ